MKVWHRGLLALALIVSITCPATAQQGEVASEPKAKKKACIIDLDGTIADETVRRKEAAGEDGKLSGKEYDAYFDESKVPGDKPLPTGRETVKWLDAQGITIFYVSSRPDNLLEASKTWIKKNGFPAGRDVIHKKERFEKSVNYKTRVIEEIKAKGYDVLFGVGDRDKDIISYDAAGIVAIKIEPNTDSDWARVRGEIEKILREKK